MEKKYEPKDFINTLEQKIKTETFLQCPYCGHDQFTTTETLATILISKNRNDLSLGPCIPAGMVICEKCGHIDFFALGTLDKLNKEAE